MLDVQELLEAGAVTVLTVDQTQPDLLVSLQFVELKTALMTLTSLRNEPPESVTVQETVTVPVVVLG